MKRKFQKGDRVLVRKTDLQEWVPAKFSWEDGEHFLATEDNGRGGAYYQCRHIDDFRTGDKVQVRDSESDEWEDATYAVYVPSRPVLKHVVFNAVQGLVRFKFCRWHPSMPWAEKEAEEELDYKKMYEDLSRAMKAIAKYVQMKDIEQ